MRTKPKIEIDLKKVESLAGLGLSRQQIADALGISQTTLYDRQRESAEFVDAIKRGKAQRVGYVANKLQKLVDEGNLGAIIFYLKTQGGFIETQRQLIADDKSEDQSSGLSAIYKKMTQANRQNND